MFKKRRGIKLPYNKQGLVHFTCLNTKDMSQEDIEKIKQICSDVAGEYAEALFTLVTDDRYNIDGVANRYYTSASQLYRFRTNFYNRISPKIKITIDTDGDNERMNGV